MKAKGLVISIIAAAFIASVAHAAVWEWSPTASSNATSDPTINWAEGMSPSSVNDSARAMMARLANYRDDISGLIVTAGTATAYTVATNQGLDAIPQDGQLLAFTPHATNGVSVSLTADGGTTYPIQTSPGVAVSSATLVQGTPYTVKFSLSNTAWMLRDFYGQPFQIPVGALLPYTGTTAPNSNFVLPYGQCISRTTYAAYFAQVSTTFGVCDGTTTFAVPDMRGRGIAAIDNLGGTASSRLTTTYFGADPTVLGNVGGAQNRTVGQDNLPNVTLTTTLAAGQGSHTHSIPTTAGTGVGGTSFNKVAVANDVAGAQAVNTGANTLPAMTGTTPLGGSGTPLATVQPTMVLTYILRIL